MSESVSQCPACAHPDRRAFFKRFLAVGTAAVATAVPIAAGMTVLFDPLRRKSAAGEFVRVTTLDALAQNAAPQKFSVLADRVDAWNKFSNVPLGAVYLRRIGESTVEALNVVCPHAGCFVDFRPERESFYCPCHNSSFGLDGRISDASSPAARGLDSLEVQVRGKEVWVKFQNFRAGTTEKIPVA